MRRDRHKPHSYGQKGGEGPNKGKVKVTYQAQDPDGNWQQASMMVNPKEGAPKLAYIRFYQSPLDMLHHSGKAPWRASGVRAEPDLTWSGVWIPAERFR